NDPGRIPPLQHHQPFWIPFGWFLQELLRLNPVSFQDGFEAYGWCPHPCLMTYHHLFCQKYPDRILLFLHDQPSRLPHGLVLSEPFPLILDCSLTPGFSILVDRYRPHCSLNSSYRSFPTRRSSDLLQHHQPFWIPFGWFLQELLRLNPVSFQDGFEAYGWCPHPC